MGNSSSQQQENKADKDQLIENSSGVHMIELHAPTLGRGSFFIFLIGLSLIAAFLCLRNHNWGRRRRSPRTNNSTQWETYRGFPNVTTPPNWDPHPFLHQMPYNFHYPRIAYINERDPYDLERAWLRRDAHKLPPEPTLRRQRATIAPTNTTQAEEDQEHERIPRSETARRLEAARADYEL